LDPLGTKASNTYLQKMGATTTAMVRGQFVIAICQGFAEALILQIAGVDHLFFFMFFLFTLLSIIPLGSGIVAIPVGIVMLLTGNIWQGVFVLLGHFLIVTNIDNVLRPRLVPREVRLNSALTMLGVFAGLAMFGFLGIVIGPVIMILITTTVGMYLESRAKQSEEAAHD
jgi:predicted PurR-regulated permease PerM